MAMRAAPTGTTTKSPSSAPATIASPSVTKSVVSVGRTVRPMRGSRRATAGAGPITGRRSPRSSTVPGAMGIPTPPRWIARTQTARGGDAMGAHREGAPRGGDAGRVALQAERFLDLQRLGGQVGAQQAGPHVAAEEDHAERAEEIAERIGDCDVGDEPFLFGCGKG